MEVEAASNVTSKETEHSKTIAKGCEATTSYKGRRPWWGVVIAGVVSFRARTGGGLHDSGGFVLWPSIKQHHGLSMLLMQALCRVSSRL